MKLTYTDGKVQLTAESNQENLSLMSFLFGAEHKDAPKTRGVASRKRRTKSGRVTETDEKMIMDAILRIEERVGMKYVNAGRRHARKFFPTIRALAKTVGVSPLTVKNHYYKLVNSPKSGLVMTDPIRIDGKYL